MKVGEKNWAIKGKGSMEGKKSSLSMKQQQQQQQQQQRRRRLLDLFNRRGERADAKER